MTESYPLRQPLDTVFARLTDPEFIVARSEALGEGEATCVLEQQGNDVVLDLTREFRLRNVPRLLVKILPVALSLEFREHWWPEAPGMAGRITAEVMGLPLQIETTMALRPAADGGCIYTVEHSAAADIPLISESIERFVNGHTGDRIAAEVDYLKKSLA